MPATAAQRRRLIEAIAFIRSHRSQWEQGAWVVSDSIGTCGTQGCIAGHVAITLNPSTPVVKVPTQVWKKKPEERTKEEQRLVRDAYDLADLLLAKKNEIGNITVDRGKNKVKAIHVQNRALNLLGHGLVFTEAGNLFSGTNKLADVYRIAASGLKMSRSELIELTNAVIAEKGWGK